jgi:hypothetical protein
MKKQAKQLQRCNKITLLLFLSILSLGDLFCQDKCYQKDFVDEFITIKVDDAFIIDGFTPFFTRKVELGANILNKYMKIAKNDRIDNLISIDSEQVSVFPLFKIENEKYKIYVLAYFLKNEKTWYYDWVSIDEEQWDFKNKIPKIVSISEIGNDIENKWDSRKMFIYNSLINNFIIEIKEDSTNIVKGVYYKPEQIYYDTWTKPLLDKYSYRGEQDYKVFLDKSIFNTTQNLIKTSLVVDTTELPSKAKNFDKFPSISRLNVKDDEWDSYFIERYLLTDSSVIYLYNIKIKSNKYSFFEEINYYYFDKNLRLLGYDNISKLTINNNNEVELIRGKIIRKDDVLLLYTEINGNMEKIQEFGIISNYR